VLGPIRTSFKQHVVSGSGGAKVLPYTSLPATLQAIFPAFQPSSCSPAVAAAVFGAESAWAGALPHGGAGLTWPYFLAGVAIGCLEGRLSPPRDDGHGAVPPSHATALSRMPSWRAAWGTPVMSTMRSPTPMPAALPPFVAAPASPTFIARSTSGIIHAPTHPGGSMHYTREEAQALEVLEGSAGALALAQASAQELHGRSDAAPSPLRHVPSFRPSSEAASRPILKHISSFKADGSPPAAHVTTPHSIRFTGVAEESTPPPPASPSSSSTHLHIARSPLTTIAPEVEAVVMAMHLALDAYMQLDTRKAGKLDITDIRTSMAQLVLMGSPSHGPGVPGHSHRLDEVAVGDVGGRPPLSSSIDAVASERFKELGGSVALPHKHPESGGVGKLGALFSRRSSTTTSKLEMGEEEGAALTVDFASFLSAFVEWFGVTPPEEEDEEEEEEEETEGS
jgi:hypothetical protein